jgi:hypothetical protein
LSARQSRITRKAVANAATTRAGDTTSMRHQWAIGFSEFMPAAQATMLTAKSAGALANFVSQKTRLMPSF